MYMVRWFYENKWRQRLYSDLETATFNRSLLMKNKSVAQHGVTIEEI